MPNSNRSALARRFECGVPLTPRAEHTRTATPGRGHGQRIVAARGRLVMRKRTVQHAEFLEAKPFFDVAKRVRHVGC